ncbi:MAG: nitroreductase family protein [Planctomycetota bacterium]
MTINTTPIRKMIKLIPGARALKRRLIKEYPIDTYDDLPSRTESQILSIIRHEAHRIEKSMYNHIFEKKRHIYEVKKKRVVDSFRELESRGFDLHEDQTVLWAMQIIDSFDDLDQFIDAGSTPAKPFAPENAEAFVEFVRQRRSVRVWADDQPSEAELRAIAEKMIDAARWAPTSGNRQPWRFRIITDTTEKDLLKGLKEEHCTSSPLLIFVGMRADHYGALGNEECSIYIDAGAATMQMVLTAHRCGLGVCWNHFAMDLIRSRPANEVAYRHFAASLGIDAGLVPVAIICIGRPKFIPPTPARSATRDLMIRREIPRK